MLFIKHKDIGNKIYQVYNNEKKTGGSTLISHTMNFKTKNHYWREKGPHIIMKSARRN